MKPLPRPPAPGTTPIAPLVKPATQSKSKGLLETDIDQKAKDRYDELQRQKKSG